jgi:predicted esterase
MTPHRLPDLAYAGRHGLLSHKGQGGELDYFAYAPRSISATSSLLVTVHGIDRKALQHAMRFAPWAEQRSFVVLAPHFSKARMPRYQKTFSGPSGESPLDAFDLTVDHFLRATGMRPATKTLFGYSGGAQFAQRYVLRGRLAWDKLVLAAPGWFTMPDSELPFPYGLGASISAGASPPDLDRLMATPTLVLVGSEDTHRDSSLNREAEIDAVQGLTRLERAGRWTEAMTAQAARRGVQSLITMKTLPGAGHDFEDNMKSHDLGRIVCDWLDG